MSPARYCNISYRQASLLAPYSFENDTGAKPENPFVMERKATFCPTRIIADV
jgi:hypothetical protein